MSRWIRLGLINADPRKLESGEIDVLFSRPIKYFRMRSQSEYFHKCVVRMDAFGQKFYVHNIWPISSRLHQNSGSFGFCLLLTEFAFRYIRQSQIAYNTTSDKMSLSFIIFPEMWKAHEHDHVRNYDYYYYYVLFIAVDIMQPSPPYTRCILYSSEKRNAEDVTFFLGGPVETLCLWSFAISHNSFFIFFFEVLIFVIEQISSVACAE